MDSNREFRCYDVKIYIDGFMVENRIKTASAPCKAVELVFLDNKVMLRTGIKATCVVECMSLGLKFCFDIEGS